MTDGAPVLAARRLAVGYRSRAVLSGIDAYVVPGGSVALVGSNGSGKSTLLRTIVGLLPPVSGALEVLAAPAGGTPHRIAYLSQFHASGFVLPLRAVDVVRMGRFDLRPRFARARRQDEELVQESMRRMGVADLAGAPLRSLSGGQQQRVYLAQVLARRADLIVLDEPTAGLDAPGRELYVAAMAEERRRGAAIVTSTHDLGEAADCDTAMLLAGRVIAEGPPETVLTAENLLATFGVALTRAGDRLIVTDAHHLHDDGLHGPHLH